MPSLKSIQNKYMKRVLNILLVALIAVFTVTMTQAQNVIRNGNVFTQQSKQKAEITKTKYVYVDKDGVKYPIYLSSKGKAFIIKVSKKTGKEYRQYLPEITKQISL